MSFSLGILQLISCFQKSTFLKRNAQLLLEQSIYPTNILLKKMDLANSDRCSFCLTETDFIEHFFYECLKIKRIWSYVEQLFYARHGLKICLNAQSVLLGIIDGKTQGLNVTQLKCINFFILVAKCVLVNTDMVHQ